METINYNCDNCDKEFQAKRLDAKFCSGACKQNAYRERIKFKNEQHEADLLWEQAEFAANNFRKKDKSSAGWKGLKQKIEELENENDEKQKLAIEESRKLTSELFKSFEDDIIRGKIDNANTILKEWLQQLLEFDQEEETPLYKAKYLFEKIIKSGSYTFYDLPNDYKYLPFINHTLIPKAKNWYDAIKDSRERYVSIALSMELNQTFTDILYEID